MKFSSVVKRMAKGSVEPLLWVAAYFAVTTGASKLIAAYTAYPEDKVYFVVWLVVSIAVLLYWAYGYTKWNMEWEQRQIERELKYKD